RSDIARASNASARTYAASNRLARRDVELARVAPALTARSRISTISRPLELSWGRIPAVSASSFTVNSRAFASLLGFCRRLPLIAPTLARDLRLLAEHSTMNAGSSYPLISAIDSPADLRKLSSAELEQVAAELRQYL